MFKPKKILALLFFWYSAAEALAFVVARIPVLQVSVRKAEETRDFQPAFGGIWCARRGNLGRSMKRSHMDMSGKIEVTSSCKKPRLICSNSFSHMYLWMD
jgi:hypothetical protein